MSNHKFNTVEKKKETTKVKLCRIPVFGRDIAYHPTSADLYMVGGGSQMYRLNLEQGRSVDLRSLKDLH